jgi:hypothetical protein
MKLEYLFKKIRVISAAFILICIFSVNAKSQDTAVTKKIHVIKLQTILTEEIAKSADEAIVKKSGIYSSHCDIVENEITIEADPVIAIEDLLEVLRANGLKSQAK